MFDWWQLRLRKSYSINHQRWVWSTDQGPKSCKCTHCIPLILVCKYTVNKKSVAATDEQYTWVWFRRTWNLNVVPSFGLHFWRPRVRIRLGVVLILGWAVWRSNLRVVHIWHLSVFHQTIFIFPFCLTVQISWLFDGIWSFHCGNKSRLLWSWCFNSQPSSSNQPPESGSYLSIKTSACAVV